MRKPTPKKTVMPHAAKTTPAKEPKNVPKKKMDGPKTMGKATDKPTLPPWLKEKR